ncbi:hypothetical protein CEQ83_02150 [Priestia megaterium]|uniref:hypothetical protein n=1 Tax=Priestia megaterium TaxID=1404 RepID=UPI0012A9754C|nr:hypothetical protein [Priestia megaterium]QFY71367.1 hypothetical protein CEQ83_02150 [Priestia megaterium]
MTHLTKKVGNNELKPLSFTEQKLQGLKRRCPNNGKEAYILSVEKKWEAYAFNRSDENLMNDLLKTLSYKIEMLAKYWGKNWRDKRLSPSDFESVFYEAAFKLCDEYEWSSEFYFYETILLIFERRAIDLTRKFKTQRGGFEASILPLKEEIVETFADAVDIEKEVLNRNLVTEILNDKALTIQEKKLLQEIYNNPDASYKDWAEVIGLKHHQQVIRMLQRIKCKIFHVFL